MAIAKVTKIAICHYDAATMRYERLMVADTAKAVAKHRAHGDALPGEAVPTMPGSTFDDACTAVADVTTHELTVDSGPAAGTYTAVIATFGPSAPAAGVAGAFALVNAGGAIPTQGCGPLAGFPAGSLAVVDRGTCSAVEKAANAQAAGAVAVIIVNDVAGPPPRPDGTGPSITIPTVMISQSDGAVLKAGLPATGTLRSTP
jgi:hypothetical protein